MSRQTKKPAQQVTSKVKNVNLLPSIFNTEPNRKMLSSTLDPMTSKGQLLPFTETYGLRSASNRVDEFFIQETDEVRRESQANNMLVLQNPNDSYLGKVSYLDIENFYNIKNSSLVDGVVLDNNINILDLPINPYKLTDYNQYYWIPGDLPACRIHLEPDYNGNAKFSIKNDIINKGLQYITLIDDFTGKSLELQSGMIIYFTGKLDDEDQYYLTTDIDQPKTFYVTQVANSIRFLELKRFERRVPNYTWKKREWDNNNPYIDPPAVKWDSEEWDGSQYYHEIPEYVVQEKSNINSNHWQVIDFWQHITTIRAVANFLGINVSDIVKKENKAKRPIISINNRVELYNWPTVLKEEVASILPFDNNKYKGYSNIKDPYGYNIENGTNVIFEDDAGIYQVSNLGEDGGALFTRINTAYDNDGVILTSNHPYQYYRFIFKNKRWTAAQNKIEPNQTPLFEFYLDENTKLSDFNDTDFAGGVILGFKEGNTYDEVLNKHIEISNIDFDLINENNPKLISPNQIKFYTDIDNTWTSTNKETGELFQIIGPYGYSYSSSTRPVFPFYQNRKGLDFTKQTQDVLYDPTEEEIWSAEIQPLADTLNVIHVYYNDIDGIVFYTDVEGYGNIRLSTKKGFNTIESVLPLVSGKTVKILCHDLPNPFKFYKISISDNISKPILIEFPYCEYVVSSTGRTDTDGYGITDGIIYLDLNESISLDNGLSYIDNEISLENTLLQWSIVFPESFKYKLSDISFRSAWVNKEYNWRFLQNVYIKDKTNPIYHDYEYVINDVVSEDGSIGYNKEIKETSNILNKISNYDKILVEGLVRDPVQKTAPLSLTSNPLNDNMSTINYYSMYQHSVNKKSHATNSREYINFDSLLQTSLMGGGTFIKHSSPLSKFSIVATNLPFDLSDLMIKQGKHYDIFLSKLRFELEKVINLTNDENHDSYDLLSRALYNIYRTDIADDAFWAHSNMFGWGEKLDNYRETNYTVTGQFNLDGIFESISHRAGKELLLQISHNGRFLVKGIDYNYLSTADEYVSIIFDDNLVGESVNIKQWYKRFNSQIPASLAKLGLVPIYKPEIYYDMSQSSYMMIRHDGSKYYLENGVIDNYPVDLLDQLLYEYEIAVWANMSYDVETNDYKEIISTIPGYFRNKEISFNKSMTNFVNDTNNWLVENNIFDISNNKYNESSGFTKIYQLGSGDDDSTIIGSWRLIYKFVFDTDRPHTHPWEMLGYTIKPTWWDNHYSWTDPIKRSSLEIALRTGKISDPDSQIDHDFNFARCNDKEIEQSFPVDNLGQLLPPDDPSVYSWLGAVELPEQSTWPLGGFNEYEQVFANTHRGIASMAATYYIRSASLYVNRNWVPGQQIKNAWGHYIDRTTKTWQQCKIEHNYHRSIVDGEVLYTSGIESLYGEFCVLNNKDFKAEVIDKFNNVKVNKEFLLNGFTNKENIRIQSTSVTTQNQTLFVPYVNYNVRTIKHYPKEEKYYSGIRIVYDGAAYNVFGFNKDYSYFNYYSPIIGSSTTAIQIGDVVVKEKTRYDLTQVNKLRYNTSFVNRFDLYDFILGYGKWLVSQGYIFEDPEGGDIRNWQLSAKQFIFWSSDHLASGNYIDLNPAADRLVLVNNFGHLETLEGLNEDSGHCVDRNYNLFFAKDLLISRTEDAIIIKSKNNDRSIYGIKMVFSDYESVLHLNSISDFGDVYFLPEQSTTKRSFVVGGTKTIDWSGEFSVPGFIFSNNELIPNLDSMAEQGRTLLDVESVITDPIMKEAARDQFGLNRNVELKQLFLQEDSEVSFKTAISYNKGTRQVFKNLAPLTQSSNISSTIANEEYMVRTGELGNTHNIEYYEFEISSQDLKNDSQSNHIIKFVDHNYITDSDKILYINDKSSRWVYKPYDKNLRFNTYREPNAYYGFKSSPVLPADTDFGVNTLNDIDKLFSKFEPLWSIPYYDEESSYKTYDQVRYHGKVYYAKTTVSPNTWGNNNDKFSILPEPFLPNIFVNNYYRPNPNLNNVDSNIFNPGTWQVLQTIDRELVIVESCPGPTDSSKCRISTNKAHKLKQGDYILIVNCETIDGIWMVDSVESDTRFYINTTIIESIKHGKIFSFKPVRFKDSNEFNLATGSTADDYGYSWKNKVSSTDIQLNPTPSGYDPVYPIAIVDDGIDLINNDSSFDSGNYQVYGNAGLQLLKEESLPVDISDIEHLIIYDHSKNKTVIKLELYNPRKLAFPEVFKKDIDVISRVDPARYNRTTDEFKNVYTSLSWFEEMVGKRWWDTSTLNFADYETGDDVIKAKYWGTTTDNKLLDIYEWTKSPVPPDQWAKLVKNKTKIDGQLASGEAYVDSSLQVDNYHWVEEQDYISGQIHTIYYFWVKNKKTINYNSKSARTYTVQQLSSYILNPTAAGIPWWSPIGNNSIVLKGIEPYINSSGTVIQIKKKLKGNNKHQQWTFISENKDVELIPEWIHVRFRDSISSHIYYKVIGEYFSFSSGNIYNRGDIIKYNNKFYICTFYNYMPDSIDNPETNIEGAWIELTNVYEISGSIIGTWDGYFWDKIKWDFGQTKYWFWKSKSVPESDYLHRYNRSGNDIRPYIQSWFDDILEARRTFIKKLNETMVNVDIRTVSNWGSTRLNDSTYKIADEVIDITKYWTYVDFKSEDFDQNKEISVILENEEEIYTSSISIGSYIKINTGTRDYVIYQKNADRSVSVVYRTNGAIKFDKILYDPVSLSSWDTARYDSVEWEYDLNLVFNAIVDSLRYEIFVGKYTRYYSTMICVMFRYVLSEQINVDWIAKSSTIEPTNLVSTSLTKNDSFTRDDITTLTKFYSTVKSYRDKIRGGTVGKNLLDEMNSDVQEAVSIRVFDADSRDPLASYDY